jgi:hypothetical protein
VEYGWWNLAVFSESRVTAILASARHKNEIKLFRHSYETGLTDGGEFMGRRDFARVPKERRGVPVLIGSNAGFSILTRLAIGIIARLRSGAFGLRRKTIERGEIGGGSIGVAAADITTAVHIDASQINFRIVRGGNTFSVGKLAYI